MANEYLKRTPTSTGNRRVFTWSGWVKRNSLTDGAPQSLFTGGVNGSDRGVIDFNDVDTLRFGFNNSGSWSLTETTAKFRDSGSWMNVIVSVDLTTSGNEDVSIYVNGIKISSSAVTWPSIVNNVWNAAGYGMYVTSTYGQISQMYEGEMFDVFWVDGQALEPDVFGFYKDGDGYISVGSTQATDFRPGQWSPHSPSKIKKDINRRGGFGVNGYYLPMNDSSNPGADFHCAPNSIIKLKGEDLPQPRNGAPTTSDAYVSQLRSDPFAANLILAIPCISIDLITNGTFDSNTTGWTASHAVISAVDGKLKVDDSANAGGWSNAFYVLTTVAGRTYNLEVDVLDGSDSRIVGIYQGTYTANSGTAPSTTVGTYTSSQKVTTSFTATGTSVSIILAVNNNGVVYYDNVKVYDTTPRDYSADIRGSGTNKTVTVNGTFSVGDCPSYYGSALKGSSGNRHVAVSSHSDFANLYDVDHTIEFWYKNDSWNGGYLPHNDIISNRHSTNNVAWRISFTDKNNSEDGIQVFGSNGLSSGSSTLNNDWNHCAVEQYNGRTTIYINGVAGATNGNKHGYQTYKASTGPIIIGSDGRSANLGDTYAFNGQIQDVRIYKGLAKYKGGFDVPKPYTPVGIEAFRTTADTCKNNFVTMNPLNKNGCILSNGNLTTGDPTANGGQIYSTMGSNTGKWYYEAHVTQQGAGAGTLIGINPLIRPSSNQQNRTAYRSSGDVYSDSSTVQTGTAYITGDIIGVAWDADNKKLWFAKNGSWVYSGDPANGNNPAVTYTNTETQGPSIQYDNGGQSQVTNLNFGQNPTFSGQVTAGTNADGNGKGLFKYAPPSGFLALCEDNLPTPAIADPGDYMRTVLYTGSSVSGSEKSRSVSGLGFKPDLVWLKSRSIVQNHQLYDSVRGFGGGKGLSADENRVEGDIGGYSDTDYGFVSAANNDGFDVLSTHATGSWVNNTGVNYCAWCWKAGGPAVSNTDGSITTQVSANPTAGFSIVKGTQTSGTTTFGHGLGKAPKMVITKQTNGTTGWYTYHKDIGSGNTLRLDTTAASTSFAHWVTDPTTSVFSMGSGFGSGEIYVAYCFAEIEGYSKFGSYVGNASTDGPFVYCGFKPAFIMFKNASATGNWVMSDSSRDSSNPVFGYQVAEGNALEERGTALFDSLSNGFKIRNAWTSFNGNTNTIIFMAFAESPFQTANAK
jgi:hypothetical protein